MVRVSSHLIGQTIISLCKCPLIRAYVSERIKYYCNQVLVIYFYVVGVFLSKKILSLLSPNRRDNKIVCKRITVLKLFPMHLTVIHKPSLTNLSNLSIQTSCKGGGQVILNSFSSDLVGSRFETRTPCTYLHQNIC